VAGHRRSRAPECRACGLYVPGDVCCACNAGRFVLLLSLVDGDTHVLPEEQARWYGGPAWRAVAAGSHEAVLAALPLFSGEYRPLGTQRWRIGSRP
jgi:hypothetical protein